MKRSPVRPDTIRIKKNKGIWVMACLRCMHFGWASQWHFCRDAAVMHARIEHGVRL